MFQSELRNDIINKSFSWHTIMAQDCSVNFPVAGLIKRLQELTDYRALLKKRHNLTLHKPKIQVFSGPPRSINQTTVMSVHLNLWNLLLT